MNNTDKAAPAHHKSLGSQPHTAHEYRVTKNRAYKWSRSLANHAIICRSRCVVFIEKINACQVGFRESGDIDNQPNRPVQLKGRP